MSEKLLVPSIEMRLSSLLEINRRKGEGAVARNQANKAFPTITISREFGCEAYPMTECLKGLLEKKTGQDWIVMDKGLLGEVAKHHRLSEDILRGLGEKSRILDEMLATFTPRWKSEKDHYRLLCKHMFSLAEKGNVIIVGRGSAIVTQSLKNCYHFRMFASPAFKIRSIARRLNMPEEEAESYVEKKQKQRDAFIRDFLDQDAHDMRFYNLIFNNNKNSPERIAQTILEYVTTG
ncbi:MAG: cytidylate kinase-like family protein [Geobacteraceae bacterium]|nr:cytidylate kinase-like family protein [Geobacteraceae bacterium]